MNCYSVCSGGLPSLPYHPASSRVFVPEGFFHANLVSWYGGAPGGKMPPDTAGKDARRYGKVAEMCQCQHVLPYT